MTFRFLYAAFAATTFAAPALAQDAGSQNLPAAQNAAGYPSVSLLSTGTTVVGEPIRYPATGPAHVSASLITLAPGQRTAMHKHGVPMFAYILEGEITVDYGKHGKRTYRPGDSLVEAMHVPHFGQNTGNEPMRSPSTWVRRKRRTSSR